MQSIAIVGAGQAGLQLALALQAHGRRVTLVSDRRPEEVERGRVMSTQALFHDALEAERALGLDFWEAEAPPIEGIGVNVAHPAGHGERLIAWAARLDRPAQSVDQRLKFAAWMRAFARRGGDLRFAVADVALVESLAAEHDLVLVATGKGELGRLFATDPARSARSAPARRLALAYLRGVAPRADLPRVSFNVVPGAGEVFLLPGLTFGPDGRPAPYENLLIEAIPGGPLDRFAGETDPARLVGAMLGVVREFLPWEADRLAGATPTDDGATLVGAVTPTVRRPVAVLPSGRAVLGLGDAVVLNDPITGQGSGTAAKAAALHLDAILARGGEPFDAAWMHETFERFWAYAGPVTAWTNAMLDPPPPHVLDLLGAAQARPGLARAFVNAFNHPPDFFPWIADPGEAARFVAGHAEAGVGTAVPA